MPVYTIETPGGHKLDIEAATEANAVQGAQQWYSQNGTATSGLGDALRQGLANTVSGVGETLKQTGIAPSTGDALKSGADRIAPTQAPDTTVVSKDGVNAANVPRMLTEQAPGLAAVLAAAKAGAFAGSKLPGGPLAKTLGGLVGAGLAGAGMIFGPKAKENAAARTGDAAAEPNTSDKVRAGLTTLPEAALGALGVSRFFPGAGKVVTTGLKGAGDALKQAALRVGENAAASGAQDVVAQTGKTLGTDKGLSVDPYQVANAGVSGGITAGAFAAPKAAADVRGAVRDRAFGGDNAEATTQVANRIQKQSEADNRNLKNTRDAASSVTAAKDEIKSELQSELSGLKQRNDLGLDTTNALNRAVDGTATKTDFGQIADATGHDPSSERIVALARQASVMNKLLGQGVMENGVFKGGIAAKIGTHTGINPVRAGAVAGGTLLANGAFPMFGIYSAPALGAAAGGWALARGVDRLTGARSPANRFVQKFANAGAVRPDVATAPPTLPGNPTGPKIAPTPPSPWGSEPPPSATPDPKQLIAQMRQLEVARNASRQQTVNDAIPALRQLATTAQEPQAPPEPAPTQPPKDVLSNTRSLVRSLQAMQAFKQKTLGENQANTEAANSPFLEQTVGGPEAVANPAAGKRISQMVSAARAMNAMRSDPQAQAEAQEASRSETQAAKQEAAAQKASERKAKDEQKASDRKAREEAKTQALATRLAAQATKQATREVTAKAKADAKAEEKRARDEAKAKAMADKLAAKPQVKAEKPIPAREEKAPPKADIPVQEDKPFVPKTDAELPFYGFDHADVADAKVKDKGVTGEHAQTMRAGIIRGRMTDEKTVRAVANKLPDVKDRNALYDLIEHMHHTSSRSETKKARDYYAAKLPKEAADELRHALSDGWIARNKHRP